MKRRNYEMLASIASFVIAASLITSCNGSFEVDLSLTSINFTSAEPIIREVIGPYSFSIGVKLSNGIYGNESIYNLARFNMLYFLAEKQPPVECKETVHGQEYLGYVSTTKNGQQCDFWNKYKGKIVSSQFLENDLDKEENFCRNPNKNTSGPWCYVNSTSMLCDIPVCQKSETCRHYERGSLYTGKHNYTISGHTCQRWDQQYPHKHGFSSLSSEENYCRCPIALSGGPWCYSTNPAKLFEECGIPFCYPDAEAYLTKPFVMKVDNISVHQEENLNISGNDNSVNLTIQLPLLLDVANCPKISHICFLNSVKNSSDHFETNFENNMICKNIENIKSCKPSIEITPVGINFTSIPVRGYKTTVGVIIRIKNMNYSIPISPVQNLASNFRFNVFMTNYDMKTTGDPFSSFKIAVQLNVSLSQLQQGIIPGRTETVIGEGNFLVEREKCLLVTHICTEVIPGVDASYTIYPGTNHLICFKADHSHKNCEGLLLRGVELISLQEYGKSRSSSYFNVAWTEGTDLHFSIDFGDNSGLYSWSWQNVDGNQLSYRSSEVMINHTYKEMGLYVVALKAWNNINSLSYNTTIYVEPDLNSSIPYIQVSPLYSPAIKPVLAKLQLSHLRADLGLPIAIVCDVNWGDGLDSRNNNYTLTTTYNGYIEHTYKTKVAEVIANITCHNHVSNVTDSFVFIFRNPISGLKIVSQKSAYPTHANVLFNISMDTGSHVRLFVDFGDGSYKNFTNVNIFTSTYIWVISHIYKVAGNFSVSLQCVNEHFKNDTILENPVIIQNPVSAMNIIGPPVIKYPNGYASFKVVRINSTALNNHIFCSWYVNGIATPSNEIYLDNYVTESVFDYTFNRESVIESSNISVKCHNFISEEYSLFKTKVIKKIREIIVPNITFATVDRTFNLTINTSAGSDILFNIDFGDGQIKNITHPNIDSAGRVILVSHKYMFIGNHSVSLIATNVVSQVSTTIKIVVYNVFSNVSVTGNGLAIWPPANATLTIKAGKGQKPLFNLHCFLTYGKGPQYVYVEQLNTDIYFQHNISFPQSAIGKGEVNITCGNKISASTFATEVEVILDAVLASSLEIMDPVWWTNRSKLTLNIKRFGANSCFLWNMGDGEIYLYGLEWCQTHAYEKGIKLNLIKPNVNYILHDHVYKTWGIYNVTVTAFNHVSQDFTYNMTIVKDWYCNKPILHFPKQFAYPFRYLNGNKFSANFNFSSNNVNQVNFSQIMRGVNYDIQPENVTVDCMKSLNKTESILTVYDLATNNKMLQVFNVSMFKYEPRMLPVGLYYAKFTLMMLGVRHVNTTEKFYFEIIKTPLVAAIEGKEHEVLNFNEEYVINAFDGTIDLDSDPTTNQAITFVWYCRQSGEELPRDSKGNILSVGPANFSATNTQNFSGCFGGGAGKLPENSGKFILDTGLMIPNTTFIITVLATRDGKTAESFKVITLESPAAPEITIRCKENCENKKRISGSLILVSNCTDNCQTKYGSVRYFWTLEWYDKLTGNATKYTNLVDVAATGISSQKLIINPFSLVGGVWHNATLVAWTPYSLKTVVIYRFLTNLPPYGGKCWVEPSNGFVMETFFQFQCDGWKEWLLDNDAGLKYEYRVRSYGKKRGYLLYFGNQPTSEKMYLPMGNFKVEFINEVVLFIKDTVGDYYELIQNITVSPPQFPKIVILNKILNLLNDTSSVIGKAIAAKQYQVASSTIYSMLSLVNLPSDVKTTNITEDDGEILRLKIFVRSQVVDKIASFPVTSMDSLDQTNELLIGSVESPNEVELDTLDVASSKLEGMSGFYVQNRESSSPEKKKQLVTDMTASCLGMIISSDTALKESSKSNESSVILETTTSYPTFSVTSEPSKSNSSLRFKVGNIMKKSVAVMDDLTDAQLNDKEVGTPADIIAFGQLTLVMEKQDGSQLSNTKFSTNNGGVEMGQLSADLANSGCVKKSTALSAVNPYIWDESADSVKSSVLKFGLSNCDDKQTGRTRRAAKGDTSFNVELPIQSVEKPIYVQTNSTDENGMVFHYLELNDTQMPVIVSAYPDGNDTLEVLVQFNKIPTMNDYYTNTTLPLIINDSSMASVDLYELKHAVFISSEVLTSAKATRVYVGIRISICTEGELCRNNISYSYKLSQTQCQIWDEAVERWVSEGCEVQPGSTPTKIKFKSNLFGSMGAGLFVGPNTIDFANVFYDFSKKLAENAAVFWTVIGIIILYVPCLILGRIFDKKDRRKWMIQPLCDNNNAHEYGYELHVYTGMKGGSGTTSNVNFVIAGTESDTGIRYLHDGERKNFQTGDVNSFIMRTETSLGVPCTLKIWHDNSGTDKKAAWYLSKIVVVDLQTQKWYLFLCDQWLSTEHDDGRTERVLRITSNDEKESRQALLENNIKRKLFDDHLWLSIGYRKTRSTFTRVQRLSCCFAILYLTMVSNAMWFGTEDSAKTQSAFTIGPISMTVHQLYTSLMSSLIVLPPTVLISLLFANRDTSHKKKSYKRTKVSVNKTDLGATGIENRVVIKKKKKLPFWCIFIAYFLVFLSIVCGAFFTILYAFEWGKSKSEEWLMAFLMSFVQSVLLIQPLKVVVVAALISFLLKKDTDVADYEERIGKMQLGNKDLKPANEDILKMTQELSEEEKQLLKRNQNLDKKMNTLIRGMLYDAFFLFLLLWVVMGNQSETVYLQNSDLRNIFLSKLSTAKTHNQTWKWFNSVLLQGLYLTTDYNLHPVPEYDTKFISNAYSMRLGPPRLRQLRAKPDLCTMATSVQGYVKRCSITIDDDTNEDHNNYIPTWQPKETIPNKTILFEELQPIDQAFQFQTEEQLNGLSFWGLFQWYNGGGYVANLGNTKKEAELLIQQLQNNNWIDQYTRVVFVEFNVWNPNSNFFNMFVLTFEFTTDGSISNWVTIDSINLYRYTGAAGLMNLLAELILTLFIIVVTILEIRKVVKSKGRYLKQFWNCVLGFCLICYYMAMGVYAWRSVLTVSKVEEMMNNRAKSINFQVLVTANTTFMFLIGLMSFLMEIRLLNTFCHIRSVSVMIKTLSRAIVQITSITTGFSLLFIAYISMFFLSYSYKLFQYRSFGTTATYLTTVFFGTSINFPDTIRETGYFGAITLLSYLLLMLFFWMNVFIAVLDGTMHEVQGDEEFKSLNYKVLEHMMKKFSGFIKSSDKRAIEKKDDKSQEKEMIITSDKAIPPITCYKEMDYARTTENKQITTQNANKKAKNQKKKRKYELSLNADNLNKFDEQLSTNVIYPAIPDEKKFVIQSDSDLKKEKGQENLRIELDKLFGSTSNDFASRRPQSVNHRDPMLYSNNDIYVDSGISSELSSSKDLNSFDIHL